MVLICWLTGPPGRLARPPHWLSLTALACLRRRARTSSKQAAQTTIRPNNGKRCSRPASGSLGAPGRRSPGRLAFRLPRTSLRAPLGTDGRSGRSVGSLASPTNKTGQRLALIRLLARQAARSLSAGWGLLYCGPGMGLLSVESTNRKATLAPATARWSRARAPRETRASVGEKTSEKDN